MLSVENLTKKYDKKHGINSISLNMEAGKVYSVIGPNGSGKTTLINSIAGLLKPDSGKILLNGEPTIFRSSKVNIGYALDEHDTYPDMTLIEMLQMIDEIKYNSSNNAQIEQLLTDFGLWNERYKLFKECSLGMKKKLGICISFLVNPPLILLDEPTNGIDTMGVIMLKKEILEAKENGSTVIVTSHILDFVDKVADMSFFLKDGELVKAVGNDKPLENVYKMLYL